ncbi:MAG: HD domain-containing protein [Candidatus Peribacteria bacterium]|nr:HD domain-containing protein [Candidatus Peribacteria bacterium]
MHSLRVYELLKNEKAAFSTQIAGLLHDILEDSSLSKNDLLHIGVPKESIQLIEILTHNLKETSPSAQWESKIKQLINAQNTEARLIAVVDMIDNMQEPLFLDDEQKMRWYLSSKVAVMLYYAALYIKNTQIFTLFLKEYINLVQKVNNYTFITE